VRLLGCQTHEKGTDLTLGHLTIAEWLWVNRFTVCAHIPAFSVLCRVSKQRQGRPAARKMWATESSVITLYDVMPVNVLCSWEGMVEATAAICYTQCTQCTGLYNL